LSITLKRGQNVWLMSRTHRVLQVQFFCSGTDSAGKVNGGMRMQKVGWLEPNVIVSDNNLLT